MSAPLPTVDPRLVARLSDEYAAMSQHMGALGRDLAFLRQQVGAARPAPMPASQPVPPPVPPWTAGPVPQPPPPTYRRPTPTGPKRDPWWQREGVISKLLAVAGAGVTLIGIVMLLVLAAQAGLFGPVPRVIGGALLATGLVAAGWRVFGREGGRTGGIALAATGIAAAYLDVVAVTTIYHWLVPVVGLVAALAIAAGGIALATRWQAQMLALLVVVGAAGLAPFVTEDLSITLIGFLIVLQIACIPAQLVNHWPFLHTARTAPVVLALLGAIAGATFADGPDPLRFQLLAASVIVAAAGIGSALLVVRRHPDDAPAAVQLAVAGLPLLSCAALLDRPTAAIAQGAFAVALLGVAALRSSVAVRIAALITAVLAILQTCYLVTEVDTLPVALFAVALGFATGAWQSRSRAVFMVAVVFVTVGALTFVGRFDPETLASEWRSVRDLGPSAVIAGALGLAALVVLTQAVERVGVAAGRHRDVLWALAGLVALYFVTASTVTAGVLIGGATGFTAGHSIATMSWMVVATVALGYGLRTRRNAHAALVVGLTLTAAALAKLFLFDLATLDGLLRVAAFLVVGLLLLGAGTRYARAFADRDATASPS